MRNWPTQHIFSWNVLYSIRTHLHAWSLQCSRPYYRKRELTAADCLAVIIPRRNAAASVVICVVHGAQKSNGTEVCWQPAICYLRVCAWNSPPPSPLLLSPRIRCAAEFCSRLTGASAWRLLHRLLQLLPTTPALSRAHWRRLHIGGRRGMNTITAASKPREDQTPLSTTLPYNSQSSVFSKTKSECSWIMPCACYEKQLRQKYDALLL